MLKLNEKIAIKDLTNYGFNEGGAYQEFLPDDKHPISSLEVDFETREVKLYVYDEWEMSDSMFNLIYRLFMLNIFVEV